MLTLTSAPVPNNILRYNAGASLISGRGVPNALTRAKDPKRAAEFFRLSAEQVRSGDMNRTFRFPFLFFPLLLPHLRLPCRLPCNPHTHHFPFSGPLFSLSMCPSRPPWSPLLSTRLAKGYADGQYMRGLVLLRGLGGVKRDLHGAAALFAAAAKQVRRQAGSKVDHVEPFRIVHAEQDEHPSPLFAMVNHGPSSLASLLGTRCVLCARLRRATRSPRRTSGGSSGVTRSTITPTTSRPPPSWTPPPPPLLLPPTKAAVVVAMGALLGGLWAMARPVRRRGLAHLGLRFPEACLSRRARGRPPSPGGGGSRSSRR